MMEQSLFPEREQAVAFHWTLEMRERRGVEGDTSVSIVGDRTMGTTGQDTGCRVGRGRGGRVRRWQQLWVSRLLPFQTS